jgi:chromosome partitioning protein
MVLIPTATEFLALDGLAQMMELLTALRNQHKWNGKLAGILPTFYDEQTSESREALTELNTTFGDSVLDPIHRATILRECPAEGKTIFEMAPASRSSREYEELSREIVKLS